MGYLFPKQCGEDRPIDTFFLSRHIHAHEDRLGWERRLTCHSFRHAFGTHLYENGTDLLTIKALMGHKSLQSTTIYVHLSSSSMALSPAGVAAQPRPNTLAGVKLGLKNYTFIVIFILQLLIKLTTCKPFTPTVASLFLQS